MSVRSNLARIPERISSPSPIISQGSNASSFNPWETRFMTSSGRPSFEALNTLVSCALLQNCRSLIKAYALSSVPLCSLLNRGSVTRCVHQQRMKVGLSQKLSRYVAEL
ncbi:hypothetical protein FGO68_gene11291 [Halteria grandinella]|uniref:Uncharacterized protein n=1 Tax=Halteria grandinella TaxID=5974 RepID=A0A8J8SWG3_HALGN|nr:hypothetical protein FGO68_gene11291 [Halteria grandinella]